MWDGTFAVPTMVLRRDTAGVPGAGLQDPHFLVFTVREEALVVFEDWVGMGHVNMACVCDVWMKTWNPGA